MAVSDAVRREKPSPLMEALRRRLTEGAGVLLVFASLLLAVTLAGLLLLHVLGLTLEDWALIGRGAGRAARVSGRGGLALGRLSLWLRARLFRIGERPATKRAPRREPALAAAGDNAPEDPLVDEEALDVPPRPRAAADVVPAKKVASEKRRQRQTALDLGPGGQHVLPPIDLLTEPPAATRSTIVNEDALQQNARMLETVLEDFGVRGQIVKVRPGPVVTLYELEPAPGIKASRIIGLADDIARSMSAVSVRVAVVPGRSVIGIQLPNARAETVYLRELLASEAYERTSARLTLVLGKDIGGAPVIAD